MGIDKVKVQKERTNLVRSMNTLVLALNDEDAYFSWITLVPDGASEDDFEYIASNDELYKDTCNYFRKLMGRYGSSGFYIWGDNNSY